MQHSGALAMIMQRQEKRHLNCDSVVCDYPILFAFYNVDEDPNKSIGLCALKLNTAN